VFTQAPDGALQDVEVFAQSACIDERHGVIWSTYGQRRAPQSPTV
jgi:hypothetical protein